MIEVVETDSNLVRAAASIRIRHRLPIFQSFTLEVSSPWLKLLLVKVVRNEVPSRADDRHKRSTDYTLLQRPRPYAA